MSGMATRWFLGMVMGSAMIAVGANCAIAQITPDGTLPNNSIVTPDGSTLNITGGTKAGGNLFHSFQQFSVPTGGTAIFNNAADIQNIISRVTGGSISNIDGLIKASGTANLFLINPSGIIFGRDASLNIGGSFVATTANAIQFGNQGFFSASAPNNPELLTVNPSAFFFNQIATAPIQNNSFANAGLNPSFKLKAMGLRVPDGKSLLLVGGDINMDRGGLYAFGGRVELGGLASAGTVGLNRDGNNLSLSFPNSVERSNVSLSNGAGVNVTAGDGGSIAVNARNLEMKARSFLFAGIERGLSSDSSRAGNIDVNATVAINLNESLISNNVGTEANGHGGDVSISANTLLVRDGAQVDTGTFGAGKGGNLSVDAQDVQLIGTSANPQSVSGLFASAGRNSTGDAGDLMIKTNTLLVRDGAQVDASTSGSGNGGNLSVDAVDVQLIGTSTDDQFGSSLVASAQQNSTGDAGDLIVKTNTLLVRDGARVFTGTFGKGKGGNLTVDAQNVQLIGEFSRLNASAQRNSTGDAGDLTVKTNTLLVRDGAQVRAITFSEGKGGNLTVNAQDVQLIGEFSGLNASAQRNSTGDAGDLIVKTNTLLVKDGAQVSTGTFSKGKGGSLTVNAQNVQLIGRSANGRVPSGLFAPTERNSTGDAGDLTVKTNTLLVRDGAEVSASTSGSGKGGNLTVDAQDVQLIGRSSKLNASAQRNSTGNAGDLTVRTNTLLVRDGAQVDTGTFGAGKGGNLSVDAQDVQLIGTSADPQFASGLFASTERNSTGDAGDLNVKTNTLLVRDGSGVTVESLGTGTSGNMTVNARSIRLDNNARLTANTRSAKVDPNREQATININSLDLIMRRGSNIRTNATGENVIGGNINIDTDVLVAVENSDISANSTNFRGGNVRINAQGIFGTQFRDALTNKSDITATGASRELSGNVEIITPDIDPSNSLVNLPTVPVDTEVAQGCYTPGYAQSSFVITGRGGLPPNPKDVLTPDSAQIDWVSVKPTNNNRSLPPVTIKPTTSIPKRIVEATGWVRNALGEVELTADATTTPHGSWQNPVSCRASKHDKNF